MLLIILSDHEALYHPWCVLLETGGVYDAQIMQI